ncbi:hypothetical protein [Prosthecobacter vanneervenii]|uniref:Uncharacterized protein n=1 Tax=Prosthecobacter vanneervenii TaxID=48466 RepID=A0A7W8DI36_9BACT|nr:hypothetical protein [Prosthecobacter vanneervenii]MBB5030515.1 hypothetical protein [Prosthecobacter vanneervenii]
MKSRKRAPQKRAPSKRKRATHTKAPRPVPSVAYHAECRLRRLRLLFVAGRPKKFLTQPRFTDHPLNVLLRHCNEALFFAQSGNRVADSIQEDLMELLRKAGHHDIDHQYEQALRSARGILFDCAVKQVMYFLHREARGDLEKALCRVLFIEDPSILHGSTTVSEYLHDGIVARGSVFLQELTDDFRNAERRKSRLIIDDQAWTMASHWTNPHCPLWLMERPAIRKACKAHDPSVGFSQDAVNNRLKRLGFNRGKTTPIVGVRKQGNRSTIIGFEVDDRPFTILVGKEYPFSFMPPGRFTAAELKEKEEVFAEDRRKLDAISKKYGKKSTQYKDAFIAMHAKPDLPPPAPSGYRAYKKK